MMKKWMLLGLLLLVMSVTVHAEEEYRLREPLISEYVDQMTEIGVRFAEQSSILLRYSLGVILFENYDELVNVPFDKLTALYESLKIGEEANYTRDMWGQVLIHAWLNENKPDLSQIDRLKFNDFIISVIPRDFDGDGVNEYLFDITKGGQVDRPSCQYDAELVDYLIVQQLDDRFEFIDHPVPFGAAMIGGGPSFFGEVKMMEIGFEDLNADGLDEWIVLTGGLTHGGFGLGFLNTGQLYILAWRDGKLVDIVDHVSNYERLDSVTEYEETAGVCHGPEPRDVTWEFINTDDEPALEILQHQFYVDNWGCHQTQIREIEWNSETSVYEISYITDFILEETEKCAIRQAEELMWSGNFTDAIAMYKQSEIYRSFESNKDLKDQDRITEYAKLRLALAYILTDQPLQARATLDSLSSSQFNSTLMGTFYETLTANVESPMDACFEVYNLFTRQYPSALLGIVIKQDLEPREYFPERVGCDAPEMLKNFFADHEFAEDETPLDLIKSLRLPIYRSLSADFDLDGDEDWLIWLDSLMPPYSFVKTDSGYKVSNPPIDPYQHPKDMSLFSLPDDAGISVTYFSLDRWGDIEPWAFVYNNGGFGGDDFRCSQQDDFEKIKLTMWRLGSDGWTKIFNQEICPRDLESAFPEGEGSKVLYGGELVAGEGDYMITESPRYIWDSNAMKFIYEVQLQPIPTTVSNISTPRYSSIRDAYVDQDYQYIAERELNPLIVDSSMSLYAIDSLLNDYFYRALALEALNRPDEALMEYVAIYEAAPDSAWGMLAALHFEVVE